MRTFEKDVAAMIVRSLDEQIAMGLKRPHPACNGPYADLWVLPGGVVDEEETALESALRETLDETGLDLSGHEATLIDDEGSDETEVILRSGERVIYQMRFSTYQVDLEEFAQGVPIVAGDELARGEWAPISNLGNYNLCPPSVRLFHKLGYLPLASSRG